MTMTVFTQKQVTQEERLVAAKNAYVACRARGFHDFRGGMVIDTSPEIYTCSDCGTTFRDEDEYRTPFGWTSEAGVTEKINIALKASGVYPVPKEWFT